MRKPRKKKYVVWLHNHTNRLDDDWRVVWARSPEEAAKAEIQFDATRFSRGAVSTVAEHRKKMGVL